MQTIQVPRPPAEAFNKNRRVSDLIRAQVNHFKHLEQKLSPDQRRGIPQDGVTTEGEAARYIAAMTGVLMAGAGAAMKAGPQAVPGPRLVASQRRTPPVPAEGIAIAAVADPKVVSSALPIAAGAPAAKKGAETKSSLRTGVKGRGSAPKGKK